MTHPSTADLVHLAAAGDRQAWRTLYARFRPLRVALIQQWLATEPRHTREEIDGDLDLAFAEAIHSAARTNAVDFAGHLRNRAGETIRARRALLTGPVSIPERTLKRYLACQRHGDYSEMRPATVRAIRNALTTPLEYTALAA